MLDLLVPLGCVACGARRGPLCERCEAALVPAPALEVPPGVDALHVVWAYDGPARLLVAGLKYGRCRPAVPRVALAMAHLVDDPPLVVTWAPTSSARRRQRGFDPAEVLARPVARRLRRPARGLLRRTGGGTQTGRRLAERLGDAPRFTARGAVPSSVLLVDDVCTSGSTLAAAAGALRAAGAARVVGLVAARRP